MKRIQSLKKRARVVVKASLHYKQNTRYLLQIPTAIYHNKKANYMLDCIPTRSCFLLRKVDVFRRSSLLQQFTFRFSADEEIISSDDDEIICLDVHSPEMTKIKSEVTSL